MPLRLCFVSKWRDAALPAAKRLWRIGGALMGSEAEIRQRGGGRIDRLAVKDKTCVQR